jgi:hypothetical protein
VVRYLPTGRPDDVDGDDTGGDRSRLPRARSGEVGY